MANVKFKLDCPKCETEIVIRSSAQIGQKTECPKCKYRFTVPDVDDEDDDEGDETPKGKKGAKKSGNSKVLIGAVLGVLALGGLVLGAVLVLGGDKKPVVNNVPAGASTPAATPGGSGSEMPGGVEPENPGGAVNPGGTVPKTPRKPRASGLKEITNLLPGDAVSVWHLRMDELARTPLYASIFDNATKQLFLNSMTFEASDIDEILHCYVGADKDVFAIIRTKRTLDSDDLTKRLNLETPPNNAVKGRDFYLLKSNAFLTAIGKSLSLGSVLGVESKAAKNKPADDRKLALNIYDSQTILLADTFVMERFLNDLKDDGLPPFKSELTLPPPPAPANPMGPMGGAPGPMGFPGPMGLPGPGGPGGKGSGEDAQVQPVAPGGVQLPNPGGPGGAPLPPPGGFPGANGPGGTTPPAVKKSYTSNPYFRTIDPDLKKALNTLEDEEIETPAAVYVQKVDQRSLTDLDFRSLNLPLLADTVLVNWLQRVKLLGFSITAMNKSKGVATGYFEYANDDEAKKSVSENVLPILNALKLLYLAQSQENVTIRDLTSGGNNPGGPSIPGGPGGMFPGGAPGGMFPGGGPGRPPGGGGLSPLAPPGGGGGGGKGSGEDAQGAPALPPPMPGGMFPGGPGGMFPGGGPGGMFPGGGPGGMFPGGGPGGTGTTPEPITGSHIDVSLSDAVLTIQFELEWTDATYQSFLLPGIGRMTAQLKGRMSILSGENDVASLGESLKKVVKGKGSFPLGALERDIRTDRYGLPYPPEQRVSLFAELLPYLNKAGLRTTIQDKKFAWYSKENLPAAEAWVPEFLVPYYDQSAWRATHELAEGRSLGATNYVGIAGSGLDAARYDPKDPAVQKKLGLYGYDWTSKPEEVTDGLSNTIALMQVPPGYQRPWIAGGGATLAGIDDKTDKPLQGYATKLQDGTRGTTVLMGDGSVRTVRENINPAVLRAMVTRAGGEAIDDLDKVAPKIPAKKPAELTNAPVVSSVKPPVVSKDVDAEELKKLQGVWRPVFFIEAGQEIPLNELKREKIELLIAGATLSFSESGRKKEGAEIIKIEAGGDPKMLVLQPPKTGATGNVYMAYEVSGNRLKLRFNIKEKDSKDRPTSIVKPVAGDKTASYIELEKSD